MVIMAIMMIVMVVRVRNDMFNDKDNERNEIIIIIKWTIADEKRSNESMNTRTETNNTIVYIFTITNTIKQPYLLAINYKFIIDYHVVVVG